MVEQISLDLGVPPQPEIVYFALRPEGVAAREMVKLASGAGSATAFLHVPTE